MNIGLFSPNYPGISGDGGIGTYTRGLAKSFSLTGHAVTVLTTGNSDLKSRLDGEVPVTVVPRKYVPVVDRMLPGAGSVWRVGAAAMKLAADANLNVFEFPNWDGLGLSFGLRRRIPLVVRLSTSSAEAQAIDSLPNTWATRCDVLREKLQATLADGLVTHSYAHRAVMGDELQIDTKLIHVIPLGVDVYPEFIKPEANTNNFQVVFLGRLERRKGTLDLLKAIPLVLSQVPETRFVLIGPDRSHCPGNRYHKEYFEREFPQEIQSNVTFAGSLSNEEVDRYLQIADVFVAPSLYESFGLIFLEAMRWGTPVVGTDTGGIPEIVQHEKSGVLIPPGNHEKLAGAIVSLLNDRVRRRQLGEAGRRRVESLFSVQTMATRTLEFYDEVLTRKASGKHHAR